MNLLRKLFGGSNSGQDALSQENIARASPTSMQSADSQAIVVVSGLPRSGTSMMMKMLEAGGLPILSDGLRAADNDNPEGYYELERIKELDKGDTAWIAEAQGKVVKVISALLEYLPPDQTYRVLFMHRHVEEVLRSQRRMLVNRSEQGEEMDAAEVDDAEMADLFTKHVQAVQGWLQSQPNMAVLDVDYNAMLQDPLPYAQAVNQFLENGLDERAMVNVVNPDLYRNRVA